MKILEANYSKKVVISYNTITVDATVKCFIGKNNVLTVGIWCSTGIQSIFDLTMKENLTLEECMLLLHAEGFTQVNNN